MFMRDMSIGSYGIIEKNSIVAFYSGGLIQRETIDRVQVVGKDLSESWGNITGNTLPVSAINPRRTIRIRDCILWFSENSMES